MVIELFLIFFTARSSYASAVLGIVILSLCLSVRPSVTGVLYDETKTHCQYFDTTGKGNHCSFLIPTDVGGR